MPAIPCVLMRGGTSRGPYFLSSDLPSEPSLRDQVLLSVMGAGHPLQIDGIGGGHPQTSKVAIVGPASVAGADVDYLFAQVHVHERRVDTSPNCGNMLAGVGPFALEAGLVPASDPESRLVVHNVNTGTLIEAVVHTPSKRVAYDGDTRIDGVPGTAAPIRLTFIDAMASKTAGLLPTGQPYDILNGITVSCVDMAMPTMIVAASALGKTGHETPAELDGDSVFLGQLERLRLAAGERMGLGNVSGHVIPKPVLVTPPTAGGALHVRYFMPHICHQSLAITGAICIATACCLEGTVARNMATLPREDPDGDRLFRIEHPSGRMDVELAQDPITRQIRRASVIRTARRLFEGRVLVPGRIFEQPPSQPAPSIAA